MQTLSASAQVNADSVIQDNSFQEGSNASVVDSLITAQMEALVSGNMIEYDRIGELLDNCGARITTPEELAELTGGEIPILAYSSDGVQPLSSSSSTIRTEYCEYTQNGQTYDVMKIYATPANSSSVLYKTGTTTVKNSKSATATAMKFIQLGVSAASSAFSTNTVSRILKSVYNAVVDAGEYLSPTAAITDIKATYTWNTAESVCYIYFPNPNAEDAWVMKSRSSKVSVGVGVSIPTLVLNNNEPVSYIVQDSYTGTAIPTEYNSVSKAFYMYQNGGLHEAFVNKVNIKGIEGKTVNTITLYNPEIPGMIS